MADKSGRYSTRERHRSFPEFSDVPLDLPYKVEKVLEFSKDRERFSRGEDGEQIQPCWQWDKNAPSGEVMSMAESGTLQNLQAQPERESGTADWAFPKSHLNSDAVPSVVHDMLPDNSWSRLLILQPSKVVRAPIQCQLRAFKRSDVRCKYETLSYAWKEGDPMEYWWHSDTDIKEKEGNKWRPLRIACNGHQVPVKGNLGCALIHLRHSSRARAIWVDALCINQNDAVEMTEQIQAMPEIYSQAYRTIVWLGMMSENSATNISETLSLPYPEAAMASVCHLVKHWDPSQPARYFATDPETRSVEAKEPDPDCRFARGLNSYFRSPRNPWLTDLSPLKCLFGATWFGRKWVIQEVALSRSVDALFHNCRISWRWIGLAAAVMRTRYDIALREHRLYNVYNAYLMFRLSENHDLDPAMMTFVELLRLTAGFMTSEPKDVFISLLGLETSDHHPERRPLLKADHRMSYEDICISFARKMLEVAHSGPSPLAVLMDAGISGDGRRRHTEDSSDEQSTDGRDSTDDGKKKVLGPSWVPSWQPGRPGLLSPWSLDDHFATSKGLELYLDTSSPTHLTVQGIYVSTVLWTSPVAIASEDDIASSIDWLGKFPFTDPITPSHLEVYSRTLCAGRDAHGRREHDRTAMVLPFVAFAIYGVIPDTELFQWINTGRQSLPEAQQDPWNHGNTVTMGRYGDGSRGSSSGWDAEWIAGRMRFGHAAGLVARDRRLFLTAAGHMGLGPCETTAGDSVCILGGSSMPLILRPGNGERNVLVGPCYVDDIMEGEAVSAAELSNGHFGPLWSDSFRQTAEGEGAYSVTREFLVRQIVIE